MKRTASTSVPNTSSSVSRTEDVSSELGSVTETRIVLTDQTKMKPFAVSSILTRCLSRINESLPTLSLDQYCWKWNFVTLSTKFLMRSTIQNEFENLDEKSNIIIFLLQTTELATLRRSSLATTASASRFCGAVTSTTIAVTTPMNPLTSAATRTAPQDGRDVKVNSYWKMSLFQFHSRLKTS